MFSPDEIKIQMKVKYISWDNTCYKTKKRQTEIKEN